ncbi:MAG: hypothetical protein ACHRHE_05635 [Tepidisphaerales bacterium]
MLGYHGRNRYVFFYYESRGEEVIWNDGQTYGFGRGGWLSFDGEVAPLAARHGLSLSGRKPQHVLLVDRETDEAFLATRRHAESVTTLQHGRNHRQPRAASMRDTGSKTDGAATALRDVSWASFQSMELFESRQLLSAVVHPAFSLLPLAQGAGFQGYTPAQIRHAYGFDQVAGDGSGQTIAIVDAFNDPNITADLHMFDQKFGISDPASFKIVSQTGGAVTSVKTDAGWASEISLDVEWAHAIAPNANILLVETNSDSLTNLMAGVDYARHAAGVSAVSMSWGGGEFYTEAQYDGLFTTPAGHGGVTFVAASGDSGSWFGPSWPASSPNVLSVGGTSLLTSDAAGTYAGEYGWSNSGGGISYYQPEPSYQTGAQSTGGRTTPDVAYNADPNTGFAVYDSVPYSGYAGWQIVGGTSAGAPQWAALIAIADQVRAAAGKGSLDGASATLPALYNLYSKPGTAGYASYVADFHDVSVGWSSWFLRAHAGYDGVTGLGSPKAPAVIAALAAATPASSAAASSLPGAAVGTPAKAVRHAAIVRAAAPQTGSPVVSPSATAKAPTEALVSPLPETAFSAHPLSQHGSAPWADADATMIVESGGYSAISPPVAAGTFASQHLIGPLAQSISDAAGGIGQTATHSTLLTSMVSAALPELGRVGEMSASAGVMSGMFNEAASIGAAAAAGVLGVEPGTFSADDATSRAGLVLVAVGAILIGYCRAAAAWREEQDARNAGVRQSMFSLTPIEG